MRFLDRVHGRFHETRRLAVLGRHLLELIPPRSSVLDVGCGDGLLTRWIGDRGDALKVEGTDVLVREDTLVPVTPFDGETLPWEAGSFDVVLMVDVLHHCEDPGRMLVEAARVARRCLVLKDHNLEGWLAGPTLRFMDRVSNLKHGVEVPCNYWRPDQWRDAFARGGLRVEEMRTQLGLYPGPARLLFERSLHFVARLRVDGT